MGAAASGPGGRRSACIRTPWWKARVGRRGTREALRARQRPLRANRVRVRIHGGPRGIAAGLGLREQPLHRAGDAPAEAPVRRRREVHAVAAVGVGPIRRVGVGHARGLRGRLQRGGESE